MTTYREFLQHRINLLLTSSYFTHELAKKLDGVNDMALLDKCFKQGILSEKVISIIEQLIPICFKIGNKVFLLGEIKDGFDYIGDSLSDEQAIEVYDMTTEMTSGDSYSFYCSTVCYFPLATTEETENVSKFLTKNIKHG